MLHTSAVPASLIDVLTAIQPKATEAGFALAGGTSLALRFGHRLSVDLDFFTTSSFEPSRLSQTLGVGPESIIGQADGTLQLRIQDVKIEFLRHAYPPLAPIDLLGQFHLWSLPDVVAMKLNAISNRGSKKDFYDLAALLDHFTLSEMLDHYRAKYQPASLMMCIRSLAWFADADAEPDPVSLRNEPWIAVKDKISTAIRTLA
jgi:hypothetical protein